MRIVPQGPWFAAVSAGLTMALALRLSSLMFAAGPVSVAVAVAVGVAACVMPVPRGRLAAGAAVASALCLQFAARIADGLVWLGGYTALPALSALVAAVALACLGAPGRRAVAARRGGIVLAVVTGAVALVLPVPVVIGGALATALAREGAGAETPIAADLKAAAGTLPLLLGTLVAWSVLRAPLDPSPLGAFALVAGGGLGLAGAFGRWALVPGAILFAAAVGLGWERSDAVLALDVEAGALLFGALGLGSGLVIGSLRPSGRALAAGMVVASLLLGPVLRALPPAIAERAATSLATVRGTGADALRARATRLWSGVGPAGAGAIHRLDTNVLGELDGSFADPDSRAGAAERFAGTLAGCATSGRARARVGGDDLGLAVGALRAQGFLGVDTAVPDAALARAHAAARPDLERTWLHPSVRLVALPAPAVIQAGPAADAIVEISRTAWTDGRQSLPNARSLAAARATLLPSGVHVLALSTTGLDAGVFHGVVRAFVEVYPGASLWLPPAGADTAVLLGPRDPGPLPWSGLEKCLSADPTGLAALSVRSALDIGALALADADALRALPAGSAPGIGLPRTLGQLPALPLSELADAPAPALFSGAPEADLAARAESRKLFLQMLGSGGSTQDAFERARALATTPGGARALEPVVAPHLTRAKKAMARGRDEGIGSKAWEEAETSLLTARMLLPTYAPTLCMEGELAAMRGQFSRAEDSFAACAKADPTSLDAWNGLARVRRARGNLPGTEEALRKALEAHPERWTSSHRLGVFLSELGRYEEAERLLRQALAIQSRDTQDKNPAPNIGLARLYLDTKRAELALAQAQRAYSLAQDPANEGGKTFAAEALGLRGAARFDLRQYDEAEADFRGAVALDPRNVLARGGLGQVQWKRGEYELAAASFKAVLEVDANNAAARENLKRLGPLLPRGP